MASPFDRLMNTVRPHLPGALDRAIKQELFLVCHDFFTMSNTWREDIEFTILAGETEVEVLPVAGRINNLLYVKDANGNDVPGLYMTDPGTVQVRLSPSSNTAYTGTFGMTVVDPIDADSFPIVPTDLVEQYTNELTDGIRANMMAQPAKPYTNLNLAQFYMSKYRGGRARARNNKNTGHTFGSQRWAFPQTFRVR